MVKCSRLLVLVSILSLIPTGAIHAEEDNLIGTSLDQLLNMDFTVSTSGKEEQKLSQVPDSVWIITAEDIRRSGITNVGELLRLVPGIDVTTATPYHYEVNARGHEEVLSRRMLILVDSRPTSQILFRTNNVHNIPVVIEEIERVEVILGAGSTLYGSGAFRGIVNIITKMKSKQHATFRLVGGPQWSDQQTTYSNAYASAIWWEEIGKLQTRISANFDNVNSWSGDEYGYRDGSAIASRAIGIYGAAQYNVSDSSNLKLTGGYNTSEGDYAVFYLTPAITSSYFADLGYTHKHLLLDNDHFESRIYYRGAHIENSFIIGPGLPFIDFTVDEYALNASAMYRFKSFQKLTTIIGLEGELQGFDSDILDANASSPAYVSAFLQERFKITPSLQISAGLRLESQFIGDNTSTYLVPKGSLLYTPAKGHAIRMGVGKAFLNPSLANYFMEAPLMGNILAIGTNPDIQPEESITFEAGYEYSIDRLLRTKIDMFYATNDKTIVYAQSADPNIMITYANDPTEFTRYGFELSLTYTPTNWIRLIAAYAFNMGKDDDLSEPSSSPYHKIYAQIYTNPFKNWEFDLTFYSMSMYSNRESATSTTLVDINPVDILNAHISYKINNHLSLAFVGFNLIGAKWADFYSDIARDTEVQTIGAEVIGRRFMLQLNAQF